MDGALHCFTDLDTLAGDVHALFDGWIGATGGDGLEAEPDATTLFRLKLAVHEWVANLVQHARFAGRAPEVTLRLVPTDEGVECTIEDNSEGFDLHGQIAVRHDLLEPFPERGMGLLMLQACSARLAYGARPGAAGRRLTFLVAPPEQDVYLDLFA